MREGLHENEDGEDSSQARMKAVLEWSFVDVVAVWGLGLLLLWRS